MPDHWPATEVLLYQDRDDRWRARIRLSVGGSEQTTINVPESRSERGFGSRLQLLLRVERTLGELGARVGLRTPRWYARDALTRFLREIAMERELELVRCQLRAAQGTIAQLEALVRATAAKLQELGSVQ